MARFSPETNKSIHWTPIPLKQLNLSGKKVVIVGGTGGIGRAFARAMASRNAEVTVVGRTFHDAGVNGISFIKSNLALMSEARLVAKQISSLGAELIIFTTGIMPGPERNVTAEGIEVDLAVSYLSRLVIVKAISADLNKRPAGGATPRIFIMGFPGTNQAGNIEDLNSEKEYAVMSTHMNTVAGNEALVIYAAKRYPNVNFFGLNPGFIKSNIRSNVLGGKGSLRHRLTESIIGLITISADKYARKIVPLFFSKDIETVSGAFFGQGGRAIVPSRVMTDSYVQQYIDASEKILINTGPKS